MTSFTEPMDSLDPDLWAVYGDYLSDQGRDEEGERARCISRGLKKTGGNLWLQFRRGEEAWAQSAFHLNPKYRTKPYLPDIRYEYRWVEDSSKDWSADRPNNPVKDPGPFLGSPHLVKAYWDKLAELGKASSS